MSELTTCIEHITNMIPGEGIPSLGYSSVPQEVRSRIVRLFEEGVTMKQIVNLLVARQHTKHEEKVLGKRNHDRLQIEDLKEVEKILGVNDTSDPENRELWAEKFQTGRAKYWCPQCGYAGNDEFRDLKSCGDFIGCYQCAYFDDPRYFTRAWTPEQKADFETKRRAKAAASEAERIAEAELRKHQQNLSAAVHDDAVKATEAIDRFMSTEWGGEDDDEYRWDEELDTCRKMAQRMTQTMVRAAGLGRSISVDEIVSYFKDHLNPKIYDVTNAFPNVIGEFNRVASMYDQILKEGL
jgi:hypothetical protein